jgi:sugar/nucleoside kinase (ribokinase family)
MTKMMASKMDVAVIGHLSVDTILLPTRTKPFTVLGGAAAYTSFAVKTLGGNISVISKVGDHFPEAYLWWLKQEDIDVSAVTKVAGGPTTSFELEYNKGLTERTLRLKSKGLPITVTDIPMDFHAKAIHIAPIADEISFETVERLKQCCDIISLDPQGLLRNFEQEGIVSESTSVDPRIFSLIDIYKSSQEEIYALTGESELKPAIRAIHDVGIETVIITLGERGSVLSVEGALYNIPACHSQVVVDPTGAGDVFIGGFLSEYVRQKESVWCAFVGSAAASFVVEGIGPTFFGKKDQIFQRAQDNFEK